MKNKRKKQFFGRSLFYYRRFGHLSDHYQYNKLSKNETKQKTKLKTVDSNNIEIFQKIVFFFCFSLIISIQYDETLITITFLF
jgi:hypothetical protein